MSYAIMGTLGFCSGFRINGAILNDHIKRSIYYPIPVGGGGVGFNPPYFFLWGFKNVALIIKTLVTFSIHIYLSHFTALTVTEQYRLARLFPQVANYATMFTYFTMF